MENQTQVNDHLLRELIDAYIPVRHGNDLYAYLAKETGLPRAFIKAWAFKVIYGIQEEKTVMSTEESATIQREYRRVNYVWQTTNAEGKTNTFARVGQQERALVLLLHDGPMTLGDISMIGTLYYRIKDRYPVANGVRSPGGRG